MTEKKGLTTRFACRYSIAKTLVDQWEDSLRPN